MARIVLNERPTGCWDCPFYALFDCKYYRDDQIFPGYCEYITTPDELKEENKYMEKAIHDGCTTILKNGKTHV